MCSSVKNFKNILGLITQNCNRYQQFYISYQEGLWEGVNIVKLVFLMHVTTNYKNQSDLFKM